MFSGRNIFFIPGVLILILSLLVSLTISCGGGGTPVDPDDPDDPDDPNDPEDPIYVVTFAGSVNTTCSEDMAVFWERLYVADGPSGVRIVDISNHSHPEIVGTIHTEHALRVYIHSDHLYVCDASGGLKVYSLATPDNPLQTFSDPIEYADSISFHNANIYLGNYYDGFRVYSRVDPAHPALVNEVGFTRVRDVYFLGDRLLLSDNPFGLRLYTETSPGVPSLTYTGGVEIGNFEDVVGYGNYAIIARNDEDSKLMIHNVVNQDLTAVPAEIYVDRFIEGLTTRDDNLVAAYGEDGVVVYSLKNLPSLDKTWELDTPGYARRAKWIGDSVYVADMNQVRIYDIIEQGGAE